MITGSRILHAPRSKWNNALVHDNVYIHWHSLMWYYLLILINYPLSLFLGKESWRTEGSATVGRNESIPPWNGTEAPRKGRRGWSNPVSEISHALKAHYESLDAVKVWLNPEDGVNYVCCKLSVGSFLLFSLFDVHSNNTCRNCKVTMRYFSHTHNKLPIIMFYKIDNVLSNSTPWRKSVHVSLQIWQAIWNSANAQTHHVVTTKFNWNQRISSMVYNDDDVLALFPLYSFCQVWNWHFRIGFE